MLIISRKKEEKIIIADDIEITILEVGRNRVRFGINAPQHIRIQTRLKTSPAPEAVKTENPSKTPVQSAVVCDFPIAVGMTKRR